MYGFTFEPRGVDVDTRVALCVVLMTGVRRHLTQFDVLFLLDTHSCRHTLKRAAMFAPARSW